MHIRPLTLLHVIQVGNKSLITNFVYLLATPLGTKKHHGIINTIIVKFTIVLAVTLIATCDNKSAQCVLSSIKHNYHIKVLQKLVQVFVLLL